jgi:hypothetical protein
MQTIDYNEIVDDVSDIPAYKYKETELKAIVDLARNIGLYEWKYDTPVDGTDPYLHVGPIAQDLLRIPELASAVKEVDGHYVIDSKYIALAALSYCATLARILSQTEYKGPNA